MKSNTRNNIAAAVLLVIGSSAMLAELLHLPKLKGLALASQVAPYTKVFCAAKSYEEQRKFETFSSEFTLHYDTVDQRHQQLLITPEVYQKLAGPYNRRNVYGAILAYGPALPPELQKHSLQRALSSDNAILTELGLPSNTSNHTLSIAPKSPNISQTPFHLKP
ncbi:MAG: hypothetical protein ABGY95_00365 [Rubritalea sp.]|uniref:hypothetical protein n=1 Tax=Rubritalea sp. TaxID=2109375 RepID=UPI003242D0DD